MSLYRLENVVRLYNGRRVLDIDRLSVDAGAIIGLTGPNGGGKSTLLRVLALLDRPESGMVYFNGGPATGGEGALRRGITMLDQTPYLLKRSVRANVAYGLKLRGVRDVVPKTNLALEMVGLDPKTFASRSWYELSGGESRRVALAARLALEPRVLILDEPTANLDRNSADLVCEAAIMARERWGAALVVAGHDLQWLADVSDRILFLAEGKIVDEDYDPQGLF